MTPSVPFRPPQLLPTGVLPADWALDVAGRICRGLDDESVWTAVATKALVGPLLVLLEAAADAGSEVEWNVVRDALLSDFEGLCNQGAARSARPANATVRNGITFIIGRCRLGLPRDEFLVAACQDYLDLSAPVRVCVAATIAASLGVAHAL